MPSVYDSMYNYSKIANAALYHSCKTAILCDPEKMKYERNGITRIREYQAAKAGNYSKTQGWAGSGAKTGGQLVWREYAAPYDRASVIQVDAIDELNSCSEDMTPSIELLNDDFLNNQLPAEIDAANIAKYYSALPAGNKLTTTDFPVDADNIFSTLADIEAKSFDAGNSGESACFISSDVYANIQKTIAKNGLANYNIMKKTITIVQNTGLENYVEDGEAIEIVLEVLQVGKLLLIEMPKDRMYTAITLYDGQSTGQEAGGYVKDSAAGDIKLFVIPLTAGFASTRYIIDNFLVPSAAAQAEPKLVLLEDNERLFGNVEINNVGVNQKANAWEFDTRIVYGGELFNNRAITCFAVVAATASDDTTGDD